MRFRLGITPSFTIDAGRPNARWRAVERGLKGLIRASRRVEPGSVADLEVDAAEGALLGMISKASAIFFPGRRGRGCRAYAACRSYSSADRGVPATANIAPARSCSKSATPATDSWGIRHLQSGIATFQRPKLRFTPSVVRQAAPDDTNLPRFLTFRGDRRHGGYCGARRQPRIHRSQGLDSALRDGSAILTPTFRCSGTSSIFLTSRFGTRRLTMKTIGDAVMAAFETPVDAVPAAFDMREAVDQLNRDRPPV